MYLGALVSFYRADIMTRDIWPLLGDSSEPIDSNFMYTLSNICKKLSVPKRILVFYNMSMNNYKAFHLVLRFKRPLQHIRRFFKKLIYPYYGEAWSEEINSYGLSDNHFHLAHFVPANDLGYKDRIIDRVQYLDEHCRVEYLNRSLIPWNKLRQYVADQRSWRGDKLSGSQYIYGIYPRHIK